MNDSLHVGVIPNAEAKRKLPSASRLLTPGSLFLAVAFLTLFVAPGIAQDRRMVTEPVFPAACADLRAKLSAVQGGKTIAADDETREDTERIQKALDGCAKGRAVVLHASGANNAFLTGPLSIPSGVTLRIGKGAILFGSRNPRDYDLKPGGCGILGKGWRGCKALINILHADHAGVMGPGTIDGRGWAKMIGQKISWWQLAQEAKFARSNQNCPLLIRASHADDFTLYDVRLQNPGMYHVYYRDGDGFTAWGVIIHTPRTARNTDGIDPMSASDVTIAHCSIHAGDDDVSIKSDFGRASAHITVEDNHFYTGHGMSIGSDTAGGVNHVLVRNLTIDGADNGIRIKSNISRGGWVHDILYRNVCIRNTKHAILFDTHYPFYKSTRNLIPRFTGITLDGVHIEGPAMITLDGYSAGDPIEARFENVTLDNPDAFKIFAHFIHIELGPGPVNFVPKGDGVVLSGHTTHAPAMKCVYQKFPN